MAYQLQLWSHQQNGNLGQSGQFCFLILTNSFLFIDKYLKTKGSSVQKWSHSQNFGYLKLGIYECPWNALYFECT